MDGAAAAAVGAASGRRVDRLQGEPDIRIVRQREQHCRRWAALDRRDAHNCAGSRPLGLWSAAWLRLCNYALRLSIATP